METPPETRELILLEQIEKNPDVNQSTLAAQLGIAVGTVNWHIKRFIEKGYVKAKRAQRKKLRYIITPEGLAMRARLTVDYIDNSMRLYRRTRQRVIRALVDVRKAGYDSVRIVGDGDLAEVIRLTCLEQGILIGDDSDLPKLEIQGWNVRLVLEDS
jgi:predicted transcriptional regulator